MKRLVLGTLICTGLLIVNAWVLTLPVKAADCTAKCASGGQVQCSGHTCKAQDGVGCTAWDIRGRVLIQVSCSGD